MADYSSDRSAVFDDLLDAGKRVTLERESAGGTYNPATGSIEGGVSTQLNGVAVLLNYSNYNY